MQFGPVLKELEYDIKSRLGKLVKSQKNYDHFAKPSRFTEFFNIDF
jgi:hypothetical protein